MVGRSDHRQIIDPSGGYDYGPAGESFDSYGLEGGPQLVTDWWSGESKHNGAGFNMMDPANPYFRYIEQNIWAGQP